VLRPALSLVASPDASLFAAFPEPTEHRQGLVFDKCERRQRRACRLPRSSSRRDLAVMEGPPEGAEALAKAAEAGPRLPPGHSSAVSLGQTKVQSLCAGRPRAILHQQNRPRAAPPHGNDIARLWPHLHFCKTRRHLPYGACGPGIQNLARLRDTRICSGVSHCTSPSTSTGNGSGVSISTSSACHACTDGWLR